LPSKTTDRVVHRTVKLRLFNPSRRKREVMDLAMGRYQAALDQLLRGAQAGAEAAAEQGRGALWRFINGYLDQQRLLELNRWSAQPFKDAIKRQFAALLMSWYALRGRGQGAYPEARPAGPGSGYLHFCRCSGARDYCLLLDRDKGRYYAKMHLLTRGDAPLPAPEGARPGRMEMLGGRTRLSAGPARYLLSPLSFGARQLALLQAVAQGEAELKTADLVARDGVYALHVCVAQRAPLPREALCYLGVARGTGSPLFLTVCDRQGRMRHAQALAPPEGPRAQGLHAVANRIVALATRRQAQVVLEKLNFRGDGLYLPGRSPRMSPADYMELARILGYKLPLAGLADPVLLSPARLFNTCPVCGAVSRGNRLLGSIFLCVKCGFALDADAAGSLNLSRRLIRYQREPIAFERQPCAGGYRYANRAFGIQVELPGDEAFYDYLDALSRQARYDRRQASLILRLRREGPEGAVRLAGEGE
jgi:putative transposase